MESVTAVKVVINGKRMVTPFTLQLAGGEDEPFPLNTPVAIVGTSMLSGSVKKAR
ncbi:hypothetical protein LJU43_00020 [Enterobacter hormaechei]|nr:hypothetical protein [Enterobacter hormaechei]UDV37822.1 hypothetical protein LJU43_00020 [Enterobacter hormaechei]